MEHLLQVRNLSFRYGSGSSPLFDGASLDIHPEDQIGLWADNGTGKTTLLRIITGLVTPQRMDLTLDGEPVNLTPKEYDILRFLMQNPGKVFSPSEIYRKVWDDLPLNADNALAVHIRHIREKIEYNPAEPRYLKVVWGKGYKMEADPR